MSLINIQNLTFSYDGSYDNIFENVSFQIDTDWKLGFTGRNGRGKTTFLNLLLGKYEYKGTISKSVPLYYFPYPVKDVARSAWDILESICPKAEQWELLKELSLLEFPEEGLYRPFGTLSQGEQTKALLAALFSNENHFFLIDEPTNHLDCKGREIVSRYLNSKKSFILVSHDRTFLDNCVDHVLSINKTNIEIQKGNFSSWLQNKERQDDFERAENEKLKKDIQRLESSARRSAKWSDQIESSKNGALISGIKADKGHIGHMSAKMMKRSKAVQTRQEAAIDQKSKLLKNIETTDGLKIFPIRHHSGKLAELEDVSVFYEKNIVCEHVHFTVRQGDRIALQGKNGSGKSSLLKLILQQARQRASHSIPPHEKNTAHQLSPQYTGRIETASGLVVSYVSQDTSFLKGTLREYARMIGVDETAFMTNLAKLDFSRIQFEKKMEDYSEGQKKKVLIAGSLCENAHLYIWDEPLNFIDILSRLQIAELLVTCSPAMVFVEHDAAFAENIATQTVQL